MTQSFKVSSSSVRDQAAEKLREAIRAGYLVPGQKLVEKDLCDLLGVSRASLREALRVLEREHLIVSPHNRGPSVASLTLEDIDQLFDARSVLGSHIARRAASYATKEDLERLNAALDALRRAIAEKNADGIIPGTHAYYDSLRRAARSAVFNDLMSIVRERLTLLRVVAGPDFKRARETLAEIRAVVQAVRNRDPEAAAAATVQHEARAAAAARAILVSRFHASVPK